MGRPAGGAAGLDRLVDARGDARPRPRYIVAMPPRIVRKTATFAIRQDGTLTIAVVADTHSQPHAAMRAHLTALAPDAILHAGDMGDPQVIDQLAELAPVFVVRGNIDTRTTFPDVLTLDLVGGDRALRIYLTHIAVSGPRLRRPRARLGWPPR
jgi:hypothetical protein